MQKPMIIAVCGYKRSGKDTIANYIAQRYGYRHVKIADPLKCMCKMLFDMSDAQLEGDEKEHLDTRWGVSPRQLMQFFGTEIMQYDIQRIIPNIQRSFWITRLLHEHGPQLASQPIVISDMRFLHEHQAIVSYMTQSRCGPMTYRVIKVTNPHVDIESDSHVSEKEWVAIPEDAELNNDATIAKLYEQIDILMTTCASQN